MNLPANCEIAENNKIPHAMIYTYGSDVGATLIAGMI